MELSLGLIGAGNMAHAILGGILRQGLVTPDRLAVSNRSPGKLAPYRDMGVFTTVDNVEILRRCDLVFLAVKPQVLEGVLAQLAPYAAGKCLVSIAPGFTVAYLRERLPGCHVVRAMPNTPLLVGKGVTAVVEAPEVPEDTFRAVVEVFSAAGAVTVIPEERMNAVISLSGSSPAYFFAFADAMAKAGTELGMDPAEALRLAALSMEGAAGMLLESGCTAEELKRQVCSPGGTTLAALTAFDEFRLDDMVAQAMERCAQRAAELGK